MLDVISQFLNYLNLTSLIDTDFGFHLAQGRYFFENHWQLPLKEVFSYTIEGQNNIILGWFFDVIVYFIYSRTGALGVGLWKLFLILGIAAFFILRLKQIVIQKKIKFNIWLSIFFALLFITAIYPWVSVERPHVFGYLYFSIFLFLIVDFLANPKKWHWFAFAFLQLFWVNSHSSFITAVIITAILAIGSKWNKKILILLCLLALVSLINPYGYKIIINVLRASPDASQHEAVNELQAPTLNKLMNLGGAFWLASLFPLIAFWRKKDYKMMTIFLFFAILGLRSTRFVYDYMILTAPYSASLIFTWPVLRNNYLFSKHMSEIGAALAIMFIAIFIVSHKKQANATDFNNNNVPVKAADFIIQNNIRGKMYNTAGVGSYLIWRFYPERQVFMDSRFQNYMIDEDNSLFKENYKIFLGEKDPPRVGEAGAWQRLDEKYHFDFAIVEYPFIKADKIYNSFKEIFLPNEWAVVFLDAKAIIYLRRVPANTELIRKFEYKYIKPQEFSAEYFKEYLSSPVIAQAALQEFKRALIQNPDNYHMHFTYAVFVSMASKNNKDVALEHLREVMRLNPRFVIPPAYLKDLFQVNPKELIIK